MIALALLAAVALRPELAAFERLSGQCWTGKSPDGRPDTHCFAPVFDGQLLRDTHRVPGTPPYRGETIYHWNAAAKRIEWTYYNSFGDAYRGLAASVAGGVDFMSEGGAPISQWRWSATGYTVTSRGTSIMFVRAGK